MIYLLCNLLVLINETIFPTIGGEIKKMFEKINWIKCISIISFWSSYKIIWTRNPKTVSFVIKWYKIKCICIYRTFTIVRKWPSYSAYKDTI